MKKTFLPLLLGSILFIGCKKEAGFLPQPFEMCLPQTNNPAGNSYSVDSLVEVSYTKKHCGLLPLSKGNYWIYEDSVFENGNFLRVQFDTLRYSTTWHSVTDNLIWWESNISVGFPQRLYANDSAFFQLEYRFFTPGILDAKKEFALFEGDSVRYLTSFDDVAAQGRSVKLYNNLDTEHGSFDNCILFEKHARNYRRDQTYFKQGIGVVKYTREEAPMGTFVIKLQQVSTLIAYHIE